MLHYTWFKVSHLDKRGPCILRTTALQGTFTVYNVVITLIIYPVNSKYSNEKSTRFASHTVHPSQIFSLSPFTMSLKGKRTQLFHCAVQYITFCTLQPEKRGSVVRGTRHHDKYALEKRGEWFAVKAQIE